MEELHITVLHPILLFFFSDILVPTCFAEQEFFNFDEVKLINFSFMDCSFVQSKISLPHPRPQIFSYFS